MRFKKGDKVEVMNKNDVPVSWRVAEILCGKVHTYLLRYDYFPGESTAETVPEKFVRPCPVIEGAENYDSGDIVEVFFEFSWKIASLLKIMGGKKVNKRNKIHPGIDKFENRYLVRLLGSSRELIIGGSNIRSRQSWHNGKWILMGKNSQRHEDATASKPTTNSYQNINFQVPQFNTTAKYQPEKEETRVITSRSLKRKSPYASSIVKANNGRGVVAYPRKNMGEKNVHGSSKGHHNTVEGANRHDFLDCSSSESDASSVGSCSVNNRIQNTFSTRYTPITCEETDTLCSDAESCYGSGPKKKRNSVPPNEELEARSIHSLEFHAYRTTLEAFYASGPLSWEQEELLTNLRIMLNISNDEHSMELKQLISVLGCLQQHGTGVLTQNFSYLVKWAILGTCSKRFKDDARVCRFSRVIVLVDDKETNRFTLWICFYN